MFGNNLIIVVPNFIGSTLFQLINRNILYLLLYNNERLQQQQTGVIWILSTNIYNQWKYRRNVEINLQRDVTEFGEKRHQRVTQPGVAPEISISNKYA